jgi:hypothetical protein
MKEYGYHVLTHRKIRFRFASLLGVILKRIDLTEEELFICRMLGVMRRSSAMHSVKDRQVGKNDTWAIDIDGMVGEYCVAKYLNVCPDLTVGPRSGGADLISRTKQRIDVKTTRIPDGRLLATIEKAKDPCDIYILVIVDDKGGNIIGYATKDQLFSIANITDLGHGEGYALNQEDLKPL